MQVAAAPTTPRLRGRLHQVAFFVSVPAGLALVAVARGSAATSATAIYAVSLTAVFGASSAYHRGGWSPDARRWMKRLDHSLIFVLIAGTYTPVSVLVLHGPWKIVLLCLAWGGAAVGITLKMVRPDGLRVLTATLYMGLGWLGLVALPQLVRGMTLAQALLMASGGVLYTVGAILFAARRPDPRPAVFGYHEVWHAFMVSAAVCHYVMVVLLVFPAS